MTELRRSAVSNSNIVGRNNQESPENASSSEMQKTDSVINLTKPTLYSIYDESSMLNLNKDELDGETVYTINVNNPSAGYTETRRKEQDVQIIRGKSDTSIFVLGVKVIMVAGAAYTYNEITSHIHKNHIDQAQSTLLKYEPLYITTLFINNFIEKLKIMTYFLPHVTTAFDPKAIGYVDEAIALTLQGVAMSSIHPIMDYILPSKMSKRLLSSNPNPKQYKSYENALQDSLRSLVTFLGISYAIRNIEWSSFLQMSIIWSLLNPGLWLLLDGTFSGFLSSLVAAALACLGVYTQNLDFLATLPFNEEYIAIWLWIGSFFFCGLIIFGKLGRVIFGR